MKSAEEILRNSDLHYPMMNEAKIIQIINIARIEALNEAMNVVKTYKVGNSGSWYDAAVDRTPIINLMKELR